MVGYPVGVGEPGLHGIARNQRCKAEVGCHLRGRASPAPFRGSELLLLPPAGTRGSEREQGDRECGNEGRVPGFIGNHNGGKHEAGCDQHAGERGCRGGRPQPPGDQSQQDAETDGPDDDRGLMGGPPIAVKHHFSARKRQHG